MLYQIKDFFLDPILRGPTIGCMLMCASASLIGVFLFIRKKSLLGEVLSHAAYPGLVAGAWVAAGLGLAEETGLTICLLAGAAVSAWIAGALLDKPGRRLFLTEDSGLCFILSSFLGIGIFLAGRLQFTNPVFYRYLQTFFYGQAATMTDHSIRMYGLLLVLVVIVLSVSYHPIRLLFFDPVFAEGSGISRKRWERVFSSLVIITVIVAVKSVGVVLLSGMFIAPALTVRRFTHNLGRMLVFAGLFGAGVGFFGNYFSANLPSEYGTFPTGPSIVLFGTLLCIFVLSFTKKEFRAPLPICKEEMLLKRLYRRESPLRRGEISFREARILIRLKKRGEVLFCDKKFVLSETGKLRAKRICAAHTLWSLRLIRGHKESYKSAEEIENFYREGESCSS